MLVLVLEVSFYPPQVHSLLKYIYFYMDALTSVEFVTKIMFLLFSSVVGSPVSPTSSLSPGSIAPLSKS